MPPRADGRLVLKIGRPESGKTWASLREAEAPAVAYSHSRTLPPGWARAATWQEWYERQPLRCAVREPWDRFEPYAVELVKAGSVATVIVDDARRVAARASGRRFLDWLASEYRHTEVVWYVNLQSLGGMKDSVGTMLLNCADEVHLHRSFKADVERVLAMGEWEPVGWDGDWSCVSTPDLGYAYVVCDDQSGHATMRRSV